MIRSIKWWVITFIACAILSCAFVNCNTTKKSSSVTTTDSTSVIELLTKIRNLETENKTLVKKIKELESGVVFADDAPCLDSLLQIVIDELQADLNISTGKKDSLVKMLNQLSSAPPNEVIIDPMGNIKFKGAIRSLNVKLKEQTDSLNLWKQKFAEADSALRQKTQKKQTVKTETVTIVKSSWFGRLWWLLLVIGFVLGIATMSKVKNSNHHINIP